MTMLKLVIWDKNIRKVTEKVIILIYLSENVVSVTEKIQSFTKYTASALRTSSVTRISTIVEIFHNSIQKSRDKN